MKHTWFVPVAPLVVAAAVILTSFSLAYAQDGLTINGTVSTGRGTALKIGLDPKEDPPPRDPCAGVPAKPLHVVRTGPNGERMDDCQPLVKDHLTATPSASGRLLTINSKGIIPRHKTSELHVDLIIQNTTRAPITLGKPVIRHSSALIPSLGSADHLPPPPILHCPCYHLCLPPPWVIQPGGIAYCGLELGLPLATPTLLQSFSVRFPVLPQ